MMAQSQKKIDSLLKKANLMVFDNPDKAIKLIESLPNSLKDDDENFFNSQLTLASAYTAKGNNKKAIDYGLNAYTFGEKKNNFKQQIRALGFLANQYYNLNMRTEANFYLNKAENIISNHPKIEGLEITKGNIYFIKGLNFKSNLDCNFAVNYFEKAIQEYGKSNDYTSAMLNISIVQIQKAYCFIEQKKIDEAKQLIEQSLKTSTENNFTEHIVNAEIALAQIFYVQGDYKKSQEILIKTSERVDSSSGLSLKLDLYGSLSAKSLEIKDYTNYHKYSELYLVAKNSNDSLALHSVQNLLNENAATKNKELRDEEKKYTLGSILIMFLSLILLGFLLYRIKKHKKQDISI